MHKLKFLIMLVLIAVLGLTAAVWAEETAWRPLNGVKYTMSECVEEEMIPVLFSTETNLSIEEYLKQELDNHAQTIQIYPNYKITLSEFSDILSKDYEYMVVSGALSFSGIVNSEDELNPYVHQYSPTYIFDTSEKDEEGRKLIKEGIASYVDYAKAMSDEPLEQLLLVHDRLVSEGRYDFDYADVSHDCYGFFANKKMVCQGYAQIIYFAARELGINTEFCRSRELKSANEIEGHIWNYIELDEKWYHLDATWDEPHYLVKDDEGNETVVEYDNALHKYFLVSDEIKGRTGDTSNWYSSLDEFPDCNSDKYEKNHLFNIAAAFTAERNSNGDFIVPVPVTFPNGVVVKLFKSDELYTGPLVTSVVEDHTEDGLYMVYYYFVDDVDGFSVIVSAENDNKMLDVRKSDKNAYKKGVVSRHIQLKSDFPQNEKDLTMFFWDMDTMKPLTKKVKLN